MEEAGELPCQNFPDLFHPEGPQHNKEDDTRDAKALCQGCPIIDDCRMYALEAKEEYGIWGGLDPDERKSYLKAINSPRLF